MSHRPGIGIEHREPAVERDAAGDCLATEVIVPKVDMVMEEATFVEWLKQEGDSIDELEPLLEVNTDKVDTEIPAPSSGVLAA